MKIGYRLVGLWIVGAIVYDLPSNRASAELIFEKGSGTTLKEVPLGGIVVDDNTTIPINLGPTYNLGSSFSGRFYGQPVSSIGNPMGTLYVSENGNLNFSENGLAGDGSFFPTSPTSPFVPRIAPLWDDVMLFEGSIAELSTIPFRASISQSVGKTP